MFTFITVLILVVCVLIILTVLAQNSKGGGLTSNLSNVTNAIGVKKSTDLIEKITWGLAGTLFVLCILAAAFIDRGEVDATKSMIQEKVEEAADPFMQQNNFPVVPPTTEESAE